MLLRWLYTHKKGIAFVVLVLVSGTAPFFTAKKPKLQNYEPKIEFDMSDSRNAKPWSEEEHKALAKTLAGECYEDKELDKRLVCEVILNRVSDARFENSIIDVLETPNAFDGYWSQSREVSENDLYVAEQALSDWYGNDCSPLSDNRFFVSGENRENVFY